MKHSNFIAENESATTAQSSATTVANHNGGETAKGNDAPKSKRKPIDPVWRILGKARKGFDSQWDKDNKMKLRSITRSLPADVKDVDKFWSDFFDQLIALLRDRMYTAECERLKCNPIVLAEHIVYLGSATVGKALKLGVYTTIGGDVELYTERFSPASANKYIRRVAEQVGLDDKLIVEAVGKASKDTAAPAEEIAKEPVTE